MSIDTDRPRGTRFTIHLRRARVSDRPTQPVSVEPAIKLARPESVGNPGSDLRILLVEDSDVFANLVERYLNTVGAKVRKAETVDDGRRLLADEVFDVLITDLEVGESTGFDLISAVPKDRLPPSIAMSAHDRETIESKLISSRFTAYIQKPFSQTQLLATIETIVKKEESEGSSI